MAGRISFGDVPDAKGGAKSVPVPQSQAPSGVAGAVAGAGAGAGDAPPSQATSAAPAGVGAGAIVPTGVRLPASELRPRPDLPSGAYISNENYKSEMTYPFSKPLKGRAFIISNSKFAKIPGSRLKDRSFSESDVNKVVTALKQLGISESNFVIERNLSSGDMVKKLKEESEKKHIHDKTELFVCVVMTHGEESVLYGVDNEKVPMENITKLFTARNCAGLAMKPKVFLFQTCHEPVEEKADCESPEMDFSKKVTRIRIPSEADFLVMRSWVPGSWAKNEPDTGSWFIKTLVQMLNKNAKKMDLHKVLMKVNLEMSRLLEKNKPEVFKEKKKQVPYITSTLMRQIIIPSEYD